MGVTCAACDRHWHDAMVFSKANMVREALLLLSLSPYNNFPSQCARQHLRTGMYVGARGPIHPMVQAGDFDGCIQRSSKVKLHIHKQ